MLTDKVFGCVGNTIKLRSGLYLDLANPTAEQFTFSDIAGALSKICRFGGQVSRWYSVAEHSCHCACVASKRQLPFEVRRAALMHDAAEAFVGDVVKPLKIMLAEYSEIESRLERVIAAKFEVDFETHAEAIKDIDKVMLISERRKMIKPDGVAWQGEEHVQPLDVNFGYWSPTYAESQFTGAARLFGIAVNQPIDP